MVDERCPHCGFVVTPNEKNCGQCGKPLGGKALLAPAEAATRNRRGGRVVPRAFWVISLLFTLLGGFVGVAGFAAANGAPQEAAAAAMALLIVIAPYTLARAVDEMIRD